MERKTLESAATDISYLRGLVAIPLGIVLMLAALANWEWGPLHHLWVFWVCLLALGASCLTITRYYNEHYGRITPSTRQQVRTTVTTLVCLALLIGVSFLLRSTAGWSLDLPVNPTAAGFGMVMLTYHAINTRLRAHHAIICGCLLVAGLLPVWGGLGLDSTSNVGLIVAGMAVIATGIFDHRVLVRTFGPPEA